MRQILVPWHCAHKNVGRRDMKENSLAPSSLAPQSHIFFAFKMRAFTSPTDSRENCTKVHSTLTIVRISKERNCIVTFCFSPQISLLCVCKQSMSWGGTRLLRSFLLSLRYWWRSMKGVGKHSYFSIMRESWSHFLAKADLELITDQTGL